MFAVRIVLVGWAASMATVTSAGDFVALAGAAFLGNVRRRGEERGELLRGVAAGHTRLADVAGELRQALVTPLFVEGGAIGAHHDAGVLQRTVRGRDVRVRDVGA